MMAEQRAKRLYFTSERSADGRPLYYIADVPARDLTEKDIARLTDDKYADVLASGIYQKTEPASRRKAEDDKAEAAEKPEKPKRSHKARQTAENRPPANESADDAASPAADADDVPAVAETGDDATGDTAADAPSDRSFMTPTD